MCRLSALVARLLAVVVAVGACASPASLSVRPAQSQDARQLERDRAECQAEADRDRDRWAFLKTNLGWKAGGILAGAALGLFALFAANTSVSSGDDARVLAGAVAGGAAAGLVVGAVAGHIASIEEVRKEDRAYLERYARCLDRRGYWVAPGR
jgi:hypothetical protein